MSLALWPCMPSWLLALGLAACDSPASSTQAYTSTMAFGKLSSTTAFSRAAHASVEYSRSRVVCKQQDYESTALHALESRRCSGKSGVLRTHSRH